MTKSKWHAGGQGRRSSFYRTHYIVFLNNDRLKLEVLSLSGRLFHKYGNLLKKVPLNNSVLTLLIFNLLLELITYNLLLINKIQEVCRIF